jgi:rod shape-determining protein MreC
MQRQPSPLRTALAVVLVAGLVALAYVTRRSSAAAQRMGHMAAMVYLPAVSWVGRGTQWVRREAQALASLMQAEQQVAILRRQLAAEELALVRERAAAQENRTLRAVLGLRQEVGTPSVAAQVVGMNPASWWETVVLDRGSQSGVRVGDPVLAPGGLVGRVFTVTPHASTVLLLTNGTSAVGIQDARSGARGLALGNAAPGDLTAEFFSPTADVRSGDRLVTSGLGSGLPAGLPVGMVTHVSVTGTGMVVAQVLPGVDPTTITTVLVLTGGAGS